MPVDGRLLLGQARRAWAEYPEVRARVRGVDPGPTILVTGAYRSGTTWIGAMLAAPGVWHVHEPFTPNQGLWERELAYAAPGRAHPEVDRLVDALERGRHTGVVRLPYAGRWFSPIRLLPLRPRRVLIKDPSAALMSGYLADRPDFRTVVVFRHPGSVVGSFRRLGWPTDRMCSRLLADRRLIEDRLCPFAALLEEAATRRDLFSGTVFYGCVNRVLRQFLEERPDAMRAVSFEALCEDPLERFRELYDHLDLPYDREVRDAHSALCFGGPEPGGEPGPHEVRRSSVEMAGRWEADLSPAEREEVREVWESFEVPLYRGRDAWEPEDEGSAGTDGSVA